MFNNKTILITGGTGSFGTAFLDYITKHYNPKKVIIFSRDELKQFEMQQRFQQDYLRYFIGDVRDLDRLKRAFEDVDYVVHAAALKQVPAAEYNPTECIKTNIQGAENVIQAAISCGVKKVIALSTDKAAAPVNLYGATKLVSDKLFVAANNIVGSHDIQMSVVRYGNVLGSRGSVIPFFNKLISEGAESLPITDEKMTRFWITLEQAIQFVINCFERMQGGEIFVPKIPSYNIMDLADAICSESLKKDIGIRPGEKLHEEMITSSDGMNTLEFKNYFVITPSIEIWSKSKYKDQKSDDIGRPLSDSFSYNSNNNDYFLSIHELEKLLKTL